MGKSIEVPFLTHSVEVILLKMCSDYYEMQRQSPRGCAPGDLLIITSHE